MQAGKLHYHNNTSDQSIESNESEFILNFYNEISHKLYTDKLTDYETLGMLAFYFTFAELIRKF
ncbi:hypothetical protein COMNV_00027 [Commensalibacter sp. Nvir]|nr:hypothetical protein COMNV_00027 [Commensalibacter sp. Nvir]